MSQSRFVIKPVPVRGASSDLTRYVAKSKLHNEREGRDPRSLFTDTRDSLSFWDARKWLSITNSKLESRDVLHYVLSFEHPKDYERLGKDARERTAHIRSALRHALAARAKDSDIADWRWVAGIHLNTDNPHIHLLLNKHVVDRRSDDLRRLARLPKTLLPHYEKSADAARLFMSGTLIETFTRQVDEHAHSLAHTREILAPNRTREHHAPQLLHEEKTSAKTSQQTQRAKPFEPSHDFRR